MQTLVKVVLFTVAALAAANASAVTVFECVDADGNASFRDKCLPGESKKTEKRLTGLGGLKPTSIDKVVEANPITVYTVPDCDACDLVRHALSGRNIPFTDKGVQDNAEMQEELKSITGGLTVPAMTIGDQVLKGYSRDAIDNALVSAGYPILSDEVPPPPPAEEP